VRTSSRHVSPHGSPLLTLQRRVMAALHEPIVGDSRSRSDLPRRDLALSEDFARTARDYITPSATLRPDERLELYHRQYWYRLLDSLAEDFPALRALLGPDRFWRLIEDYLLAEPPRTPSLRHLGAGLAAFIGAHLDGHALTVHAQEVAQIEYTLCLLVEAGEGPALPPQALQDARIALQPFVRLLALRTNADTLWRRGSAGRGPGQPSRVTPTVSRWIALDRRAGMLRVRRLPRAAFALLDALDGRHTLDLALDHVLGMPGVLRRRDLNSVERWFATWIGDGWLRRLPSDQV
jgi:hypothetical protein